MVKSFSGTLLASASVIALAAGAGLLASPAAALTISGNQTGFVSSGNIADGLTIAEGAVVSPDGVVIDITHTLTGDLTNNGTVEMILKNGPPMIAAIAIKANGTVSGDAVNNGALLATELEEVSVSDAVDQVGSVVLVPPMLLSQAVSSGVLVGTLEGDFVNGGEIAAAATAANDYDAVVKATEDAYVGAASRAFANATGVWLISFDGSFTNAKDAAIEANASSDTVVAASVTAGGDAQAAFGEVNSSSSAVGVSLGMPQPGMLVQNDGSVAASSNAAVAIDAQASAADGYAEASWGLIYASSGAVGIATDGTVKDVANTGGVSAVADATFDLFAEASGDTALTASMAPTVSSPFAVATGILANLTGNATNAGAVEATATMDASSDASASASDGAATVDIGSFEIVAGAIGMDLAGNPAATAVKNDGTVKASATATQDQVSKVTAAGGAGLYYNSAGDYADATTTGVAVSAAKTFVNVGSIDAAAVVDTGVAAMVSGGTTATAFLISDHAADTNGVRIESLGGDFANAGGITATASVSAAASLSVDASDAATLSHTAALSAAADGVEIRNLDGAFDNMKTISAASSLEYAGTFAAVGDADTTVSLLNDAINRAVGVDISATLGAADGDVRNSGTIAAKAATKFQVGVTVDADGGDGAVSMHNDVTVAATGLVANLAEPAEGPLYGFVNKGTITADAALSIAVPTLSEESDAETLAGLNAAGVILTGAIGDVTNDGKISASALLDAAPNPDLSVVGTVTGLWAVTPGSDTVIVNTGEISASLSGTGTAMTKVIGLQVGFVPIPGPGNPGEVITITNSGTISGANTMGASYGIYAQGTGLPVVINQQGGLIAGKTAIAIDQGNADVLNWTGGRISGLVDLDALDVVKVFAGTGTPANKTVEAGADFALEGGALLDIGVKDAPVTFALDGTVTGTAAVSVNDDATLLIGPTGQMTVGTLAMAPEATLTFEFLPDEAGFIGTTGDAKVDGKLVGVALPGLYGDKGSHMVLEAGGKIDGTFDNVSIVGDTLLLDFSATLGEQDLTIAWKRTPFDEVKGLTVNAGSVAGALEDGYDPARPASKNDPELNGILSAMFTLTDAARYDRALNSWSGSEHAQVMRAAAMLAEPHHMALSEHLNDIRRSGAPDGQVVMLRPRGSSASIAPASTAGQSDEDAGLAFWGRAFGRWADTRGDVEADGYEEDTLGVVLGADLRLAPGVVVGIAGGYTDDDLDFDDGDAAKIKRWTIGGYVSATLDRFTLDGSLGYVSDNYRVARTIAYGDTSCLAFTCTEAAASRYDGDGWLGHAEVGYVLDLGGGTGLQPFAGLNYSSVELDPFGESGGGDLALDVLAGKGKSLQSRLGARLTGEWGSGSARWIPELRVEWRHEFEDEPSRIGAALTGLPDQPFTAIGSAVTEDLAVVGAGITAVIGNGIGVFADYQGAFGSGYNSHIIQGGVRVRF